MQEEIIFAGFGGQGVLFAGQLLAYAVLDEGRHVTWIPSYGPEMRGGTANCTVVASDEPIGSPVVQRPSIAVVFNNPSMAKYEGQVRPGGLLVVNSSLVSTSSDRTDIKILNIPATDTANALGDTRLTNVVLLGALLAVRPVVPVERLLQTLSEKLPARKQHLLEINVKAVRKGVSLAQAQAMPA